MKGEWQNLRDVTMNTKSLLLVGLLSVVPALVVACECGCDKAQVTEEAAVVAVETKTEVKKPVVAEEVKEVSAQEVVAEATPATK